MKYSKIHQLLRFFKIPLLVAVVSTYTTILFAQKTCLVLSGGGSKGLAHIGVIKALEENNIPIDCIVGTSMGGTVGGFYTAGFSIKEIEEIALSNEFQDWINGKIPSKYAYYFAQKEENSSLITLKVSIDTSLKTQLNSNFVADAALNFALAELLADASAKSNYNFDSLMIPFRCVASEILTQRQVILQNGYLGDAIRATTTVPLFYKPLRLDGRYLFDGGVYNNFPVDVAIKEFKPDIIIGSNVSSKTYNEYPFDKDQELISQPLVYLLLSKSDSTQLRKNDIYVQPDLSAYSSLNFNNIDSMIMEGYRATMLKMPRIKENIAKRMYTDSLNLKREKFKINPIKKEFGLIRTIGLPKNKLFFVERMFKHSKKLFTLEDVKRQYFRLVADEAIHITKPEIKLDYASNKYNFILHGKTNRLLMVNLGGNIATRGLSKLYVGLDYNYVNYWYLKFQAELHLGFFYNSIRSAIKITPPSNNSFYIEPEFILNNWNYFKTNTLQIPEESPAFADQTDRKYSINFCFPYGIKHKFLINTALISNTDVFFNLNKVINSTDTTDISYTELFKIGSSYEHSTLDKRMYATKGQKLSLSASFLDGFERNTPGSTTTFKDIAVYKHNWWVVKLNFEKYFKWKFYSNGFQFDICYDRIPNYRNYTSTLLASQGFYPLQDSRSLLLPTFKSNKYAAIGFKQIIQLKKSFEWRLEGYAFYNFARIIELKNQHIEILPAKELNYIAASTFVYHTILGPIGLSFNYYDDSKKQLGVFLHVGYVLFNKRSTN